jgi:hypothetical protein
MLYIWHYRWKRKAWTIRRALAPALSCACPAAARPDEQPGPSQSMQTSELGSCP